MERFLCPKLREDHEKGLQPEVERFLCPKSLLSVLLLLLYYQQQYVCAQQIMRGRSL